MGFKRYFFIINAEEISSISITTALGIRVSNKGANGLSKSQEIQREFKTTVQRISSVKNTERQKKKKALFESFILISPKRNPEMKAVSVKPGKKGPNGKSIAPKKSARAPQIPP